MIKAIKTQGQQRQKCTTMLKSLPHQTNLKVASEVYQICPPEKSRPVSIRELVFDATELSKEQTNKKFT